MINNYISIRLRAIEERDNADAEAGGVAAIWQAHPAFDLPSISTRRAK